MDSWMYLWAKNYCNEKTEKKISNSKKFKFGIVISMVFQNKMVLILKFLLNHCYEIEDLKEFYQVLCKLRCKKLECSHITYYAIRWPLKERHCLQHKENIQWRSISLRFQISQKMFVKSKLWNYWSPKNEFTSY